MLTFDFCRSRTALLVVLVEASIEFCLIDQIFFDSPSAPGGMLDKTSYLGLASDINRVFNAVKCWPTPCRRLDGVNYRSTSLGALPFVWGGRSKLVFQTFLTFSDFLV